MKKKELKAIIVNQDVIIDNQDTEIFKLELKIVELEGQIKVLKRGSTTFILQGSESRLWLEFRDYPHIVPYVPHLPSVPYYSPPGTGDIIPPPAITIC